MSYSGPTHPVGPELGPPVVIRGLSRPARGGPPLWLGLAVMILGPIVFAVAAGGVLLSSLDLGSLRTPVPNPTSLTTHEGMTYVVASEELGRRPCYTGQGDGPRQPMESADPQTIDTPSGTFYARGGFSADELAVVHVGCPGGGDRLLVFRVETGGLAVKSLVLLALAGLNFIGGLLMVIFRRRPARY